MRPLIDRVITAVGTWAEPTPAERDPPLLIDRVESAMEGAREFLDGIRCRCTPSRPTAIFASGMAAAGLLTLAIALLRKAGQERAPSTDNDASGDVLSATDAMYLAGAITSLVIGVLCVVLCSFTAIHHRLQPVAGDGAGAAEPDR